jgi:hypothetical protein
MDAKCPRFPGSMRVSVGISSKYQMLYPTYLAFTNNGAIVTAAFTAALAAKLADPAAGLSGSKPLL